MKKLSSTTILFVLLVLPLSAHPHVSMDARLEFELESGQCIGFWEEWTFDPFFSATVRNDFDANGDGHFNDAEVKRVYNGAFINLRKYGFFTLIRRGGERVSPEAVENFTASIKDNRLIYRFYVSLGGKGYDRDFYISIFDTTYYCAVRYPDEAVQMRQRTEGYAAAGWNREVNKSYPVYYNPGGAATDMTAYSTWKPGLQTAYPEEIHVKMPQ